MEDSQNNYINKASTQYLNLNIESKEDEDSLDDFDFGFGFDILSKPINKDALKKKIKENGLIGFDLTKSGNIKDDFVINY